LPLALQPKLLRAVEERFFEPVGSNQSQPVQARIIAASSRDLEQEVAAGRFRADLFYRLNVIGFCMPPPREQPRPLAQALAHPFISRIAPACGSQVNGISPTAMDALLSYAWPGNVRELRNAIERAVALSVHETIQLDSLPQNVRAAVPAPA